MTTVQMKVPGLIGIRVVQPGDLVDVDDHRADELVRLGHAARAARVEIPAPLPEPEQATEPRAAGTRKAVAKG